MFERVTEAGRHLMVVASIEARRLGHGSIGSDHMLLSAAMQPRDSMWDRAAEVLHRLGASEAAVRPMLEVRRVPLDDPPEFLPLSDDAKAVLEEALIVAAAPRKGQVESIEPEHFLHAMVSKPEFAARQVLEELGIAPEALRAELESP